MTNKGIKTGTALAEKVGVDQSSISRLLANKVKSHSDDLIRKLADFFKLSTDQIRGYEPIEPSYFDKSLNEVAEQVPQSYLPNFVLTAIKGMARMGQDGYYEEVTDGSEGYIELPTTTANSFALIAKGDSMYPAIKDGFVVWCDAAAQYVKGDNVALHKLNGAKMIKEFICQQNGYTELKSINGGEILRIPNDEVEAIYLIRGVLHPSAIRHI